MLRNIKILFEIKYFWKSRKEMDCFLNRSKISTGNWNNNQYTQYIVKCKYEIGQIDFDLLLDSVVCTEWSGVYEDQNFKWP